MKVIVIEEECHGFIGIVQDEKDIVNFLMEEDWLNAGTGIPTFNSTKKEWEYPSIENVLGENWKRILKSKSLEELNDIFDGSFWFREEKVYKTP